MSNEYKEVQNLVIQALIADLQAQNTVALVGELFEDVGLTPDAFPLPFFAAFYSAYRYCWLQVAAENGVVSKEQILSQMEQSGVDRSVVERWRALLDKPLQPIARKAVIDAARTLVDARIARNAVTVTTDWLAQVKQGHGRIREQIVNLSNHLLSLTKDMNDVVNPALIMQRAWDTGYVPPVSTLWGRMDRALSNGGKTKGGIRYHDGDLWVIGAPSGHGKSSFGCNVVVNLAYQQKASLYVTLEMSQESLIRRMLCNMADLPYDVVANPNPQRHKPEDIQHLKTSLDYLSQHTRIYDRISTPEEIAAAIKRHKVEFGDRLVSVLIDHIGIATKNAAEGNVWHALEKYVYTLKDVAMKERVAIMLFSQVPPDIEAQLRDDNRVTAGADFRGSRAVRMVSDVAMYVARHNGKDRNGSIDPDYVNKTVVQVVKDRLFGNEDWFMMNYDRDHYRITDMGL